MIRLDNTPVWFIQARSLTIKRVETGGTALLRKRGAQDREPGAEKPKPGKKGSVLGGLLATALVVGAFFGGAQYFTAKRSTTAVCCAAGLSPESVSVYRLPSGLLDKYSLEDQVTPIIQVPLAAQVTIVGADKKTVKRDAFTPSPGNEKIVKLTMNPAGAVCRIEEVPGFFSVDGEATVKTQREFVLDKASYFAGGTLFMSSGRLTGKTGEDLTGYLETGDMVEAIGAGDQVLVMDISAKAGKVSVTANVDGAKVYVDGTMRGKTPCVVTAAPGDRQITVKADGYVDAKYPVQIVSLTESPLAAELTEATGTLNVSSTPAGAGVYVLGELKGQTPLKINLKPGTYDIRVELAGYYPRSSQATIVKDTERPVSFPLVKMTSSAGTGIGSIGTGTGTGGTGSGASTVQPDRQIASGKILSRSGNILNVGNNWTECALAPDVTVESDLGSIQAGRIRPGDSVTLYGPSASDIHSVVVDGVLGNTAAYEGNLVLTSTGFKVFGDYSLLRLSIPANLQVVDPVNRSVDVAQNVPQGSRVRFQVGSTGAVVWAEYVWKAGASLDGAVEIVDGRTLAVAPQWQDVEADQMATVYVGDRFSGYLDVELGDSAILAGPTSQDIRFIWVRSRLSASDEFEAVVVSTASKEGKVLYEVDDGRVQGYPAYLGSGVAVTYPAQRKTLTANDLGYGDRLVVALDENRRVVRASVTAKDDSRSSKIYLGKNDGYMYFDGFVSYTPADDLVVVGLAGDEDLQPGSRVYVGATGAMTNYIEVVSEADADGHEYGTVLSATDALRISDDHGNILTYAFGKDTWFVDWGLSRDGLISTLFPGDVVDLWTGVGRPTEVVWAERAYSPEFRIEGTIQSVDHRTVVVSDKVSRHTITLLKNALVIKGGAEATAGALAAGDKIKASGSDKTSVDVIVVGW